MARPTHTSMGRTLGVRPAGSPILPALTGTIKLMCVGDSWTVDTISGTLTGNSYRKELHDRAVGAGFNIEHVGPATSGDYTPNGHRGVNGAFLSERAADIGGTVTTYAPDVLLVVLGLNDARSSSPTATMHSNLVSIFNSAHAARPGLRGIACWISEAINSSALRAGLRNFNTGLAAALDTTTLHASGQLVRCDLRGCVLGITDQSADVNDSIPHPSAQGFVKLGDALWPALCDAIGAARQW